MARNFRHRAERRAARGKKTISSYFALVEDFSGGFQLERITKERRILIPTARGYESVAYLENLER